MSRVRVGLALGGGGARGFAHLGVIEALEDHDVPIDVITGTSMGAVIGGAYACGVNLSKLEFLLKSLDLHRLLNFPKTSIMGLVGNTASEYILQNSSWRQEDAQSTKDAIEFFEIFAQRRCFEDLDFPFAVVAVDVDTGEVINLKSGSISRAVTAGIAVPGIHYPVKMDERFLVDGGIISKVPVELAFDLGANMVIAVDVSLPAVKGGGMTSIEILMQSEAIMMKELTRTKIEVLLEKYPGSMVLVEPEVDDIKTFALHDVDKPKERGIQAIERRIGEIRALIASSRSG